MILDIFLLHLSISVPIEQNLDSLMSNMASNRSPSPLSSRNWRNPKSSNPPTPANAPTATDLTKRNSINRKSMSSLFQDGKENHKDTILRSPVKTGSKSFMAPTISAASKFTPSPRKKILGDKNDITRASILFLDKDSGFKSESKTVEQKETVVENPAVDEVTEVLSGVTEESDIVSIRPFCCSPVTSPIVAPLDSDPNFPPYDPKKNFLSPRPQFLRYKPNPRIENLLNKEYGEDDVARLEDSFNLSDNENSDTEVEEKESELGDSAHSVHGSSDNLSEKVSDGEYGEDDVARLEDSFNLSDNENSDTEVEEKESELGDSAHSVHGSSDNLSEKVSDEKQVDLRVETASKTRVFTRSKTVSFVFLLFLVACYSVSLTDFPPMDLPIYQDVGFSEIYHESLKFAGFAKESFDVLVENFKTWSSDFVSYMLHQKSQLFPTHKTSLITFFNLTTSPVEEEFVFNRHIGTDYIQEIQEYEEEVRDETELIEDEDDFVEMEVDVDDDIDVADEVVDEQSNEIQIDDDDGFVETKSNLEDGFVIKSERLETETNDLEIASNVEVDSSDESEIMMSSVSTKSLDRICLAGFSMVMIAVSAIIYMKKRASNVKTPATIRVADDTTCDESCSSSVGNEHKKKTSNNKRESLAFSSSEFSMGSPSYGSFTTLERIPIKNKDEVMLTPIRRSSRLLKNQVS
ncbi:hypothetical protein L1987_31930 [Smallanthus sonchifolius]|uniref:Uncharacterized protein n=1 Tax=Smallanthus sonchifolius TaxID=185202 RepID=A0ACB9I6A2_9ASTR|nr:hypothetical protein L1987_31930 [Smallanthus sonchifolius]